MSFLTWSMEPALVYMEQVQWITCTVCVAIQYIRTCTVCVVIHYIFALFVLHDIKFMHYCVAIHYILALCVLQYIIYLHCLCCNTLNSCTVCCNALNTCNVCCNTSGCVEFPLTSTPLPYLPLPSFFHQTRHWFLAVPWTSCAPKRRPPSQSSLLSASRRWRRGGSTARAFTGCQGMQQRSRGCGTLWTRVRSRENTYVG